MKERQYRSNQGRNEKRYEDSASFMFYAMSVALILIITYSIFSHA